MTSENINDIIRQTVSLHDKKGRDKYGMFIAEGLKTVLEVPEESTEYIICTEKYKSYDSGNIPKYTVKENIFKKVSETKTPQGILAVAKKKNYNTDEILNSDGIFIITDRLQDPGNLGTIIRTAQAYGCKGIFISENSADVYSGKVIRSTMGAIFDIPVIQDVNIIPLLDSFKKRNIPVYALALNTEKYLSDTKFRNSAAFIIGNESEGIDSSILNKCENIIKIKMFGKTQSLNAAAACSIALYEGACQIYDKY